MKPAGSARIVAQNLFVYLSVRSTASAFEVTPIPERQTGLYGLCWTCTTRDF
jgi:hypothetical protein